MSIPSNTLEDTQVRFMDVWQVSKPVFEKAFLVSKTSALGQELHERALALNNFVAISLLFAALNLQSVELSSLDNRKGPAKSRGLFYS